ncbi:uncharacterized protein [Oscarella lobularis]|uniref:uncharacterized protein n=1 Tax=Oscarella lobularis TaxID=121494 RepID=UPI00331440C9
MDVHLDTLSDWAVQSLCETFFVPHLSSLGDIPASPLPSLAEILLGDPTFSIRLPSPIANRIIDGLARRGKLTAGVLDILLDRNRIRLTALPLYCIDVDPNAFVDKIAELVNVTSIDISFSPCWADLSTPFLKIVEDKCMTSLTSFSARHVIGEIGLVELPHFSNLRHLDIGFTSVSLEELRIFVSSLPLLEHLCISGIPVSLLEVFSTADCLACVRLKHLGLNSLYVVPVTESKLTATLSSNISAFFSKLGLLSSLDLSYVSWRCDGKSAASVKQALYDILTSSSSLTHLECSDTLSMDCVCDVLRATNRFSQLKFLEKMDEYNNKYDLGAETCQISTGENVHDYCSKHALRNYAAFSDVVTLYDHRILRRSYEVIPSPVSSMLYAGLLRMQTEKDSKTAKVIAKFFNSLFSRMELDSQMEWYSIKDKKPLVLGHHACGLLEYFFRKFLNPKIFPLLREFSDRAAFHGTRDMICFVQALVSSVYRFSPFICSQPLLLHLAVAFISDLPDDSYSKYSTLRRLFEKVPAIVRQHLAGNKGNLSKLCVRLSYFINCYPDVEIMLRDQYLSDFLIGASTIVRALCSLCYGLPSLFRDFVEVPEAVDNLAEVAQRGSYFYFHAGRGKSSYCVAVEFLSYIAEIRDLAHTVCLRKVIKAIVDAASCSPPTERMRIASSYLAALLIVNDDLDSIWPNDVESKDALVAKVFGNSDYERGFFERTTKAELNCYYYTTLVPLVNVCNCSEFPAVSAFGLNHLAYFCCSYFHAHNYFAETGLCPLCLLRKEVGADVVSGLSIPAELEDQFDAVMKACPVHKED